MSNTTSSMPAAFALLGDRLTDLAGGVDVGRRAEPVGDGAFARRGGGESVALRIVDDERVDVVQRAEDLQARTRFACR